MLGILRLETSETKAEGGDISFEMVQYQALESEVLASRKLSGILFLELLELL